MSRTTQYTPAYLTKEARRLIRACGIKGPFRVVWSISITNHGNGIERTTLHAQGYQGPLMVASTNEAL